VGYRTALAALVLGARCQAQSTQGLIGGTVVDSVTGRPVPAAITCLRERDVVTVNADAHGRFAVAQLSPGVYRMTVDGGPGYQPQMLDEIELPVAGRLDFRFRLRPLADVWESGQYRSVFLPGSGALVRYFGPDRDFTRAGSFDATGGVRGTVEPSLSQVISRQELLAYPLQGRDTYAFLALIAGVASDASAARGLGLSSQGQRPSSTNFLLDGVEHNHELLTGPLAAPAPEQVEEYRLSANGFSAQFGRTAGILANAVTRAASTDGWHGMVYAYAKHDLLNANGFRQQPADLPWMPLARVPHKEVQPGFQMGGPLRGWLVSAGFERLRFGSRLDPRRYDLPGQDLIASLPAATRALFAGLDAPRGQLGVRALSPPATLRRGLGSLRLDRALAGGRDRLLLRLTHSASDRPDLFWSPYPDSTSGLSLDASGAAVVHQVRLARAAFETAAAATADTIRFQRAQPGVAYLLADSNSLGGAVMPGSTLPYGYRNGGGGWQISHTASLVRGPHVAKAGGGVFARAVDTRLDFFPAGLLFLNRDGLIRGEPLTVGLGVDRAALPAIRPPDPRRRYRHAQGYVFAEDSLRLASRVVLTAGLRGDRFGAPSLSSGGPDLRVVPGAGGTLRDRVAGARMSTLAGGKLYDAGDWQWAPRLGVSAAVSPRLTLRASYGGYFDRPFDNLWQTARNNSYAFVSANPESPLRIDLANALPGVLTILGRSRLQLSPDVPAVTMFDTVLRAPRVHAYFAGARLELASWAMEMDYLGSRANTLIATDSVNRECAILTTTTCAPLSALLPRVDLRANQGWSRYDALALRAGRRNLRISYTLARARDVQSDPLGASFFNFNPFAGLTTRFARFPVEFDPASNRGPADFDQRHNLTVLGQAERRGWRLAAVFAARSGFPFTVLAPAQGVTNLVDQRANRVGSGFRRNEPAAGGKLLLDAGAFAPPAPGQLGDSGRNAFTAPGFFNLDLGLARAVRVRGLGEAGKATVWVDAFNVLNHANLGAPQAFLGSPDFGQARYGRRGVESGFPALTPFVEAGRQLQILLRVEF